MVLGRFKFNFSKASMGLLYKINIGLIIVMLVVAIGLFFVNTASAGMTLNTKLPAKNFNVPSGSLSKALATYAAQAGVVLVFDPILTDSKTSNGIQGRYDVTDGFATLLKGTELTVVADGNGEYSLKRSPKVVDDSKNLPDQISLKETVVRAQRFYEVGPLPGLGLTLEQIPGNVQSISAKEIKEARALSITDLMNQKMQSVTVNDYQGNPFQMDVQYRGFTAGPQIGTPQGLSVFLDGIRVNEPFGDVVNWDMIPLNALSGLDVFPGSNPIFGLNTLGGALSMKTKDGFNNAGLDMDVLTGSYGRKQLQVSTGWNNGTIGLFGAGNFFLEDGWRENSPSKVNQAFGKASYRGQKLDLNLSTLLVQTDLVGNGLYPSEMYKQDRNGSFTSEDTTKNDLAQLQLSSSFFVNDNFTITGQIYRRNSKRHQLGADAFTGLADNSKDAIFARRKLQAGEQYTCLLDSTNPYKIPDYYVLTVNADGSGGELFNDPFFSSGISDPAALALEQANGNYTNVTKNKALSADFAQSQIATFNFFANPRQEYYSQADNTIGAQAQGPVTNYSFGGPSFFNDYTAFFGISLPNKQIITNAALGNYFYTEENGVAKINYFMPISAKNNENVVNGVDQGCRVTQARDVAMGTDTPQNAYNYIDPKTGAVATVDGSQTGGTGVVEGTPTALLTDNRINQMVDGASVQFNWNFEHHKFMIGGSIDAATAKYSNSQRLGMLDASRRAYLAPDEVDPQFTAADIALSNNEFSGSNTTKSLYFSETWTPVKNWNFSASARYNETKAKNKIATRFGPNSFDIAELLSLPNQFDICPNADCSNVPTGYRLPNLNNILDPAETEKFSYYSFNPSLGATWQARENLNIYTNVAQGTRTPSVIEAGCALDKSPSGQTVLADTNGDGIQELISIPKSVVENRQCTLPTTLSGDPYLPQIKATTYDLGMRGTMGDTMKWNLGAYQTDLKDDIYFVSVAGGGGFFDTIGKTRRRGVEAGISGRVDKAKFSLNYGLTDATFQDDFLMVSNDNSSSVQVPGYGNIIRVKAGSRMPGVALHNINASVSYDLTDKWMVGLSAVVHSDSFVRGNENNEHQKGVSRSFQAIRYVDGGNGTFVPEVYTRTLPPTTNPGKVSGYAVFNLRTSYKINNEWTATILVNNLFDTEYFSAGRLGRNPFSPSVLGAIGPSGYNHNSDDWRSTNFIAPGAPRGIWFSLNYQFDAKK